MSRVLAYLIRFAVIIAGYVVASLAASAFLNAVFFASAGFAAGDAPVIFGGSLFFSVPFVALFVAYFAFIPSIPAILLAEILGKRDWLFHAVAGGIVAVVVMGFFRHAAGEMYTVSETLDPGAGPGGSSVASDPAVILFMIAAGMFGGIAYWLVAGRTAGNWRQDGGGATSPAP